MNFLNPFVLFGLAAASIPIILHLINLRKQKTVEFSTLKFLKELQKSSIKKLKIKQWLLLLLRTLLIIFAVLAFSRPTIQSSLPGFTEYSNTSMIILIDNSYSMDVSDENGNRLRQSKKIASTLINSMKEGDQALVMPLSSDRPLRSFAWSTNKDLLNKSIDEVLIGTEKANLNTNLKFASIMMTEAINLNKLVYLVSDMQENLMAEVDTNKYFKNNVSFLVANVGRTSKKEFSNLSIDSVNVISSIIQKDRPIELEVFIKNHSNKKITDNLISLNFNEKKVSQKTIDIAPEELKSTVVSATYNSTGIVKAELQLESDELLPDNNFFFAINIPKQPFVTVVSESSNIFFDAILSNMKEFNAISGYQFVQDISGYSAGQEKVLIVAKNSLTKQDLSSIAKLQSNNAKIILFAPKDNLTDFLTNSSLIGVNVKAVARYDVNPAEFTKVDKLHPIFSGVFKGETANQKEVESPKIKVEIPSQNGRPIIETQSGNFLSQFDIANSSLFYFSVPISTEWSDFQVLSIFPSLLYKSVTYLNSSFDGTLSNQVNQSTLLISDELAGSSKFNILTPDGTEKFADANKTGNNYILTIDDKSQFGNYLVKNNNKQVVAYYSINPSKSESELKPMEDDIFKEKMTKIGINSDNISILEDDRNIEESIQRAKLGTELWQLFLALALLCGLAELLVQRATKNIE
ncbi:MAG: BatA and WFA domain-containing protein [Candidatus Kapaibacterium sp.]